MGEHSATLGGPFCFVLETLLVVKDYLLLRRDFDELRFCVRTSQFAHHVTQRHGQLREVHQVWIANPMVWMHPVDADPNPQICGADRAPGGLISDGMQHHQLTPVRYCRNRGVARLGLLARSQDGALAGESET